MRTKSQVLEEFREEVKSARAEYDRVCEQARVEYHNVPLVVGSKVSDIAFVRWEKTTDHALGTFNKAFARAKAKREKALTPEVAAIGSKGSTCVR